MSKVLKNLQLTFGETAASPKVLPIASVNTLIKAIEDPEVTTRFSGHITSESGSLNAAQAYSLAIAGLTFHGNITPVDFTLKANKTEVVDGSEILFTTTGVPVSAIDFIINNVTINSGSIAKEDIENICSIENNKLIIAPAGVTYDWQATIEVKAITKYTPATEKTINIIIKHKAFNSIVINTPDVNFDTPNSIVVPISFTPVDANVPIESVRTILENVSAIYEVGVSNNNITIVCKSIQDLVLNKINIEATDVAGKIIKSSINISNKVTTIPYIESEDSFKAINGEGFLECTFGFTPEKYNVNVEFISINSSNNLISISNSSINGFTLNTNSITEDINTTITAIFNVDGVQKTAIKIITAHYEEAEVPPPPYDVETLDTLGVAIMDIDGNLYASPSEWTESGKDNKDALGVAFSDGVHRFCVTKVDKNTNYVYSIGANISRYYSTATNAYNDYDGFNRTKEILENIENINNNSYIYSVYYNIKKGSLKLSNGGQQNYVLSLGEVKIAQEKGYGITLLNTIGYSLTSFYRVPSCSYYDKNNMYQKEGTGWNKSDTGSYSILYLACKL